METVAGSQVGEISRCLSGGSDVIALEALQWVAGPRPACAASAAGNMASALEQFVNSVRQLSAQGEAVGAGRDSASGLARGSRRLGRG